jgi:hypothetical protein
MNFRMQTVSNNFLEGSKIAYSCRRVDFKKAHNLVTDKRQPVSGDLVLCKVEQLGRLTKLELRNGRRAHIFPGDRIILCYGDRYAPDYYEAIVPGPMQPCDLAATGGIAGHVIARHEKVSAPTLLIPQGMIADKAGKVLNIMDFALKPAGPVSGKPLVLMVLGTAMNSGKTTVVSSLVRGLVNAGLNAGAAKLTGTGSGPDVWLMKDCGAEPVLDMVDAGLASTYKQPTRRIAGAIRLLTDHLAKSGVDAIVLEVADGLYHEETQALLGIASPATKAGQNHLADLADGVVFAASDAMGARTGVDMLRHAGMPILAVAGMLTRSPLAVREARENIGLPVLGREVLSAPDVLPLIRQMLASQSRRKIATLQPVPSVSENG